MTRVKIVGPARIADAQGTHEPGEIITFPTDGLVALATPDPKTGKPMLNPESGQPYAELVPDAAPSPAAAPAPATPENVQVNATDGAGSKEKA